MIKKLITAAVVALGLAAPASATTMTFDIDVANSGVSLTETGSLCLIGDCGVTASLASGFGSSFMLDEGETYTFDFTTFVAEDGAGIAGYDISATLAFASPSATVAATGGGGALTFGGSILGGLLIWDSSPQTVTASDGTVFTVAFEGGFGILLGNSVTTTASVTLDSAAPVATPLPASALLLIGGIGALGLARRRKKAA